jgi:hypothetical protein
MAAVETIYSVTVTFNGEQSRLVESKQFLFTSKDAEVDFVAQCRQAPRRVFDRPSRDQGLRARWFHRRAE